MKIVWLVIWLVGFAVIDLVVSGNKLYGLVHLAWVVACVAGYFVSVGRDGRRRYQERHAGGHVRDYYRP